MTDAEQRVILDRDKWRCTEIVEPRTYKGRVFGQRQRCPVMGSEMVVVDGRAMCPHHAREAGKGRP